MTSFEFDAYPPYGTGGTELGTRRRTYAYDPIGNRTSINEGGVANPRYYCANALNEYLTRDDGQYCPATAPIEESFAYDDDGNMTQDVNFNYAWDAESRLSSLTPVTAVLGGKRLVFTYDYMGRRVQKVVRTCDNVNTQPEDWPVTATERYVYDGWNVVMTLDGGSSNALIRRFTWGLDLSATLQGAGGIGGLLAAKTSSAAYWYFYDGNGNVTEVLQPSVDFAQLASLDACDYLTQMLSATTFLCDPTGADSSSADPSTEDQPDSLSAGNGQMAAAAGGGGGTGPCAVLAHYEYDPYGNVLYSSGSYTVTNPFRFSTKWTDIELAGGKELYYYGYRYYSPRLGRWLSRDPIEERGGANLNAYVGNGPANGIDPLGLWGYDIHHDLTDKLAEMAGIACAGELGKFGNLPDEGLSEPGLNGMLQWGAYGLGPEPLFGEDLEAFEKWEAMRYWHFPADPDGVVRPDSAEANALARVGITECDLKKFGMGLHRLQDSWSHQGMPYINGIGHARGLKRVRVQVWRYGVRVWDYYYVRIDNTFDAATTSLTDDAGLWPEDIRALGLRTYELMKEFKAKCRCACPDGQPTSSDDTNRDKEVDAYLKSKWPGSNSDAVQRPWSD